MNLKMYIDGKWVDSVSGETFDAISPATGEVVATLPKGNREDAKLAIAAANRAKDTIAKMPITDRVKLCHRIGETLEKHHDELARNLAEDQGKPFTAEAKGEAEFVVHLWHRAAEDVLRMDTDVIVSEMPQKRIFTFRQPKGVIAAISPWNFPLVIPCEYHAAAIATGNAVVWNPASTTSVVAVTMTRCFEEAGMPSGVFNLITGPGSVVGDELVANEGTHAIGFTGSAEVGHIIAQRGAGKPMMLELGGNGPTIIHHDAVLEKAIPSTAIGCFINAGQVCCATERILVHEKVHDQVVEMMVAEANARVLGASMDNGVTLGPLNNEDTAQKMDEHIADAVAKGAKVLAGGGRAEGKPTAQYYQATVLDAVRPDMLVAQEESFGPIAPFITYSTIEEALEISNNDPMGLVAAVFTRDIKTAFAFTEGLQTGIVNVNDATTHWECHIPFGGVAGKKSGIGRIGGRYTMEMLTDLRTMILDLDNC